jgi:hypothetical protein
MSKEQTDQVKTELCHLRDTGRGIENTAGSEYPLVSCVKSTIQVYTLKI